MELLWDHIDHGGGRQLVLQLGAQCWEIGVALALRINRSTTQTTGLPFTSIQGILCCIRWLPSLGLLNKEVMSSLSLASAYKLMVTSFKTDDT